MSDGAISERRTRTFVSYARVDRFFADQLCERLNANQFEAFIDVQDIGKGEAWQERIQALIFAADAVVFLISPDSVASDICEWEVNEAERLSKRILPVICRETSGDLIPRRLQKLNFTFLDEEGRWDAEFPKLCSALSQNIEWTREHTRLSELAARWDRANRPDSHLLRLDVVRDARRWEANRPSNSPELAQVIRDFIDRGEEKEIHDRDRLLTTIGRAFVQPTETELREKRHEAALRIGAAGIVLSEDPDLRLVPEREKCLREALWPNRLRFMAQKYEGRLKSCEFSVDNTRLLSTSIDGADLRSITGDLVTDFAGRGVFGARFSPDCMKVVTFGAGVTIWSAVDGSPIKQIELDTEIVYDANFSADGKRLVTTSKDTARIWYPDVNAPPMSLQGHNHEILEARFDPTGQYVVTCSKDLTARVWAARTGRQVTRFNGHNHPIDDHSIAALVNYQRPHDGREVRSAIFGPDGRRVLSLGTDKTARLWTRSGRQLASFPSLVYGKVMFSRSGRFILNPVTRGVEIRDSRGRLLRSLDCACAEISPDELQVLTGTSDGTIAVWDIRDGKKITTIRSTTGVECIAMSPDTTLIASGHDDGTIRLWDASRSREIASFAGHIGWLEAARYCAGGFVRTASLDGTVRTLDSESGAEISLVAVSMHGGENARFPRSAFSDDGGLFACAGSQELLVVDAITGQPLLSSGPLPAAVTSVSFSADKTRVAAGFEDGSVSVYSREADVVRADRDQKGPVHQVAFTAQDSRLVSASIGTIQVHDSQTGEHIRTVEHLFIPCLVRGGPNIWILGGGGPGSRDQIVVDPLSAQTLLSLINTHGDYHAAAVSPDGRILAAANQFTIEMFDAVTGARIGALAERTDLARSIAFNGDGSRLITSHISCKACIWDMTGISAFCGPVSDVLCAALTNGRGQVTKEEGHDLLMQSTPPDLHSGLMALFSHDRAAAIAERANLLASTLHPKCYGPPLKPEEVQGRRMFRNLRGQNLRG